MKKLKTFLDAGVLISAYRGESESCRRALAILDEPNRRFITSDFVRLEIVPKAVYNKRPEEVAFYEAYLAKAACVKTSRMRFETALQEANGSGLNAVDALHVAAAKAKGCAEFFTTEDKQKPLFRVKGITIKNL